MQEYVLWYQELGMQDVPRVGGKNASLGEMISNLANAGVQVPGGFATTADAFNEFLEQSGLNSKIHDILDTLDVDDVNTLAKVGAEIRQWIIDTPFQPNLDQAIRDAYSQLHGDASQDVSFAVRSSATAEDMPDASFAGQQETFLNVRGIDAVMTAIKHVFASLFNDRAISYRVHQGYDHRGVALSAGIQRMVRSDKAASGVMFSIDTESGFEDVVFVTSSYGLGEMVVQGAVNPDEFYVHKPTLANGKPSVVRRNIGSKAIQMIYSADESHGKQVEIVDVDSSLSNKFSITDAEVQELAKQAVIIEKHYGRPMDIEWAKDGNDGKLYIVQARPETVRSNEDANVMERFQLNGTSAVVVEGRAIGHKIGSGTVRVLNSIDEMDKVQQGDILVTDMTDPDWEPIMKRAAAIVTNRGGRTCHAAIIARELGIPAVVGCGNATDLSKNNQLVTVSCAEGDTGYIYEGTLDFEVLTSR
ncbi:phosphoenolpyruvate synthase, partial [Pseudoalteromonas sp.]|uniref:phosphoenolpyruvate synthase n=1 Tax=Pseudoalteromonas sp. TaxID=53249 RepID=UPI003D1316B4